MTNSNNKMDNSFIDEHCTNCATKISCASAMFTKINVADETDYLSNFGITILDAILFIYGFSAMDLAKAYLDNGREENSCEVSQMSETSDYIIKNGLSLCRNCVSAFKELYLAYRQLKNLSNEASLLTKAIERFSPSSPWMKIETDAEKSKSAENKDNTSVKNCDADIEHFLETGNGDFFQSFNFEHEYEHRSHDDDEEDIKVDPLAEIKPADYESIISSSFPIIVLHDIKYALPRHTHSNELRPCRQRKSAELKKTEIINITIRNRDHLKESKRVKLKKKRPKKKTALRKIGSRQRKKGKDVKSHITESNIANVESNLENDSGSSESFQSSTSSTVECSNGCSDSDFKNNEDNEHQDNRQLNQIPKAKSLSAKAKEKEKVLRCSCGNFYCSLGSLKYHERRFHKSQESSMCDVCGKSFKWNYLLYTHKIREHGEMEELQLKCHLCDTKFSFPQGLLRHLKEIHPKNSETFICDKCGSSYKTLLRLQRHSVIHKDEGLNKEFKCTECNVVLKHEAGLQKHMRIMHRYPKTFSCPKCGKTTKNMTNMRIHMKVHDPNRQLKRTTPKSNIEGISHNNLELDKDKREENQGQCISTFDNVNEPINARH